jgi:hypothetical protein
MFEYLNPTTPQLLVVTNSLHAALRIMWILSHSPSVAHLLCFGAREYCTLSETSLSYILADNLHMASHIRRLVRATGCAVLQLDVDLTYETHSMNEKLSTKRISVPHVNQQEHNVITIMV